MCFIIKVDQPYAPFSKRSPVSFGIPGTDLVAKITASRLSINDFTFDLPLPGRVTSFSAFLDLKKGEIRVYIQAGTYFRYSIKAQCQCQAQGEGVTIAFDRGLKQRFFIPCAVKRPALLEEISCGVYKKQEIEQIAQRGDLKEIWPLWFLAAQWYPESGEIHNLVEDFQDQGLASFPLSSLRKLLVDEGFKVPTPCGKAKNLKFNDLLVDLEWSNGALKKVILNPIQDAEITLSFPAKTCRLRLNKRDKSLILKKGQILSFKKGIKVFLDRFS